MFFHFNIIIQQLLFAKGKLNIILWNEIINNQN